jgi:predicted ATPase/DNA-binding SARP family transcriptional activator
VCAVLSVRVLGPIEGWVGERRVALGGRRQLSLFALLALNANRAVSGDAIVDLLWGPERAGANKSLQMAVARVRKALDLAGVDAQATVRTVGHGYCLALSLEELDSERFAALMATGTAALDSDDPVRAREVLSEALALWRGPPLTEVSFDDFAQAEIRRLEEMRLLAIEARIEADLVLGRHADLVGELEMLVVKQRGRERLAGQLMVALYRCGRQSDALDVYQRVRVHLLEDLGLEPGPALQRLQARVLAQDPALAPPDAPRVRQQTASVSSSSADDGARSNLPTPISSLIGRQREIGLVSQSLRGSTRLCTLTGSGGVGKTRLAIEVARGLISEWRDGVWIAELAPLVDPGLVGATVATALGIRIDPGSAVPEVLASELADHELLLVLDNCEHVVATAAALVRLVLERCAKVAVLATSREPLRLEGEALYRVPSLSVPKTRSRQFTRDAGVEELLGNESVQLLRTRARAVRPDFEINTDNLHSVVEVCRHLDGIPLAIELAASRLGSISIGALSERLGQRYGLLIDRSSLSTARHQTLTALLDWSYQLLTKPERRLFARLAVFAGGFDLNAAEQVCAADEAAGFEIADQVGALVDKSLVHVDERAGAFRYRLLETVREYATTKLTALPAAEITQIHTAHRDHYLGLAEIAAASRAADRRSLLDRVDTELDNIRAAVRFSLSDADPEPGLRLVVALASFGRARGHEDESLQALRAQLARPESARPTRIRGEALRQAAQTASLASSVDDAVAFAAEALIIGRAVHDHDLTAQALHEFGHLRLLQGDSTASLELLAEALVLARELGNPEFTASVLVTRGDTLRNRGEDAIPSFAEALDVFRRAGDAAGAASALVSMGELAAQAGDLPGARAHLREALEIARILELQQGIIIISANLARVSHQLGDQACARALALDAAQRAHALRHRSTLAYSLLALALTTAPIDPTLATHLHGAADQVATQTGLHFETLESELQAAELVRLRKQLGNASFEAAYSAGQHRPQHELIAQAASATNEPATPSEGSRTHLDPRL